MLLRPTGKAGASSLRQLTFVIGVLSQCCRIYRAPGQRALADPLRCAWERLTMRVLAEELAPAQNFVPTRFGKRCLNCCRPSL